MPLLLSESTPFDYAAARRAIEERERKRREANERRFEQATRDCEAIISMIKERYNPKRIYQWGSLLNKAKFDEMSDIDIAVEGLGSAEKFFALYGDAEKMTDFSLDLVELEKVHPLDMDSIRLHGRLVYERE
jgi:predicted nucleotidyltransferase